MIDVVLSDREFAALKRLSDGFVFSNEVSSAEKLCFMRLVSAGLAKLEPPDPNSLYLLPQHLWEVKQYKITQPGLGLFLQLQQARDERARQEEQRIADRAQTIEDQKKNRRHDFAVAAFGGAITLFVEHIDDILHFLDATAELVLSLLL